MPLQRLNLLCGFLSEFIEVHTAAGAVLVELDKSDASVGGVLKHTFCRLMSKETT